MHPHIILLFVVTLELKELISIILMLVLAYLGFRLIEMKWSYKISKPYQWDAAVKAGTVSKSLRKTERTYRDKVRFYSIWLQIERLKEQNIKGAFAELGVYQGTTAAFIHEMDPSRDFHLFDTFQGFDAKDLKQEDASEAKYATSNFSDTSLEEVKQKMGSSDRIHYHMGFFPDTTSELPDQTYAFVHLDADLYAPTLDALHFFYPKLVNGGVIMIHDYHHTWPGVRKAVDEFSKKIPEIPVAISDWQGSVMILKNGASSNP